MREVVDPARRAPVYTNFEDTLDEAKPVELARASTGIDWERFKDKARAHLRRHDDHVALQRLRRNRPLTQADLDQLSGMLVDAGDGQVDIAWVRERAGELGPFIRSLVGLERSAAMEAFSAFLDETRFSVAQVRFVADLVEELTRNGSVPPSRLYEWPYSDSGGVDIIFPEERGTIIEILEDITANAIPAAAG